MPEYRSYEDPMPESWSECMSCALCPSEHTWTVNLTPWISGRTITTPRLIAHLLFIIHKRRNHKRTN